MLGLNYGLYFAFLGIYSFRSRTEISLRFSVGWTEITCDFGLSFGFWSWVLSIFINSVLLGVFSGQTIEKRGGIVIKGLLLSY